MRRVAVVLLLLAGCGLDESGLLALGDDGGAADVSAPDTGAGADATAEDAPSTDAALDAGPADAPSEAASDAADDAPYDAGPILTITGGTYALLDEDAGVCSKSGSTAASFSLTNDRDAAVDLVWVDYGCAEQPYGTIGAGGNKNQGTYVTHVWRVRDDASKSFLAGFVLSSANAFTVTVH